MPSSTPSGISILIVLVFLLLPFPWQSGHGSVMIFPVPLHSLHGLTFTIWPKIVLLTSLICPVPPHVLQVSGSTPGLDFEPWHVGHSSLLVILISLSHPVNASSKVIGTSVYMSEPLWGPVLPREREPPPKPNMSNMFPMSKPWKISSKFTFW